MSIHIKLDTLYNKSWPIVRSFANEQGNGDGGSAI